MTPIRAPIPVRMCKDTTFAAIREALVLHFTFDRESALTMATRWRALNARAEEAYYSQEGLLWNMGDPHVVMDSGDPRWPRFGLSYQPPQLRAVDESEPDGRIIKEEHHYVRHASTPDWVDRVVHIQALIAALHVVHMHSSWAPLRRRLETYDPDNDCATLRDYAQMAGHYYHKYEDEVTTW